MAPVGGKTARYDRARVGRLYRVILQNDPWTAELEGKIASTKGKRFSIRYEDSGPELRIRARTARRIGRGPYRQLWPEVAVGVDNHIRSVRHVHVD